ncbi:uncharacterized protein [Miscanthus floridulus]|uniref:uncharacterized protein n=1 Tax=Miscanthus floridulus TaxID=154761 RepID=UPI00345A186B
MEWVAAGYGGTWSRWVLRQRAKNAQISYIKNTAISPLLLVFSAPSRPPRTPPPTTSWLASSPVTALPVATEKVMTDDSIPRSQDHRSASPHSFPHDLLNVWLPSAPVVISYINHSSC